MSDTSELQEEVFVLVDREEAASSPGEAEWSSAPRRARLAGLLRPWRSRETLPPALPGQAQAPPLTPLSSIPILNVPTATSAPAPVTYINPLSSLPITAAEQQPLLLHALPSQSAAATGAEHDAFAACGAWLDQLPNPPARPASTSSLLSGMSECSGSSDAGPCHGIADGLVLRHGTASAGSFVCPTRPAAHTGTTSPSSSSSSSGSGSDQLNLWMQQGEPMAASAPEPTSTASCLEPALTLPAAAAAAAAPAQARNVTLNALVQPAPAKPAPEPQGALLSWRRHGERWEFGLAERREPELLRRLLSSSQTADWQQQQQAPAEAAACGPAAGSGPTRGRASGRHLLALIAFLALMVLLLHALHSHVLHRQLAGEQAEQEAAAAGVRGAASASLQARLQEAVQQAAMLQSLSAGATHGAVSGTRDESAGNGKHALQPPRQQAHSTHSWRLGHRSQFFTQHAPYLGRLPRFHLRRRLTLLLFTRQRVQHNAEDTSGAQHGSGGGSSADAVQGIVVEEWEVSVGGK